MSHGLREPLGGPNCHAERVREPGKAGLPGWGDSAAGLPLTACYTGAFPDLPPRGMQTRAQVRGVMVTEHAESRALSWGVWLRIFLGV